MFNTTSSAVENEREVHVLSLINSMKVGRNNYVILDTPDGTQNNSEWTQNTTDWTRSTTDWSRNTKDWIRNTADWIRNTTDWIQSGLETGLGNGNSSTLGDETNLGFFMTNIRLLNAVVLGVAVILMILFICKFVLNVFSRYHDNEHTKDEEMVHYA